MNSCKEWYDESYTKLGASSQRKYPNEEVVRFIGRHFGSLGREDRSLLKLLEVGCGNGANLWMLAQEGFNVTGLDLSGISLGLAQRELESRDIFGISLIEACMTRLPFEDNCYDAIIDCFSSNCLNTLDFVSYLEEAHRILKTGGRLFIYTPSKRSDAYVYPDPSEFLDDSTLDGIRRETSPFYGNSYPFRFESPDSLCRKLIDKDFTVDRLELVSRSYRNMNEIFEWLVCDAVRD